MKLRSHRRLGLTKNLPLRYQMVLGGISILLIPMIIVGTVTFVRSSRALEDISKMQLVQVAQSIAGMIRLPIEKDMRIIAGIASDPVIIKEALSGEHGVTQKKLSDLYQMLTADYEGFGVFDTRGVIRVDGADENRIGITIAHRTYFRAAMEGKSSVGSMVSSMATRSPIFVLCTPIMSTENTFLGGVIGVVKADYLMRYISSIQLGTTGYAFMIDREGTVIAHPDEKNILTLNIREVDGLEGIADGMIRRQTGTVEYTFRGVRKVAGFTPVRLAGWSIAVTQTKKEIMALAYANRNFTLLIGGVFTILTLLAVFYFSGTISTPVQTKLTTLSHAVEQAAEAFVILGLDGEVQFANPALAAIVDQPTESLIGKPLRLGNDDQFSREDFWNAFKEGDTWNGHITGRKKDGSDFTMDITITPVLSRTGALYCYLAVGRDISKELIMQERIQHSQKMEAIGTLAGGIAHDFNNILTGVFGFTELALANLENPDGLKDYLTEVLNASRRARDLVTHILTFSRKTEAGQKPIIPKYIIKEALELLRASLPSTIEIREKYKSSAAILGNPTQIHQITMNLCTNAWYAMKDRGGVLEVSLNEIEVNENFSNQYPEIESGGLLELKVADTGRGIPHDILERIFDPFFTTKPTGEGTGLGLSVVHGIAKSLNGMVTVSSETGKGTVFTIHLPIVQKDIACEEKTSPEQLPGGSERILMVDDEKAIILSGKTILENLGYRVLTFDRADSAWEAFFKNPDEFDAVITDYTMPRMTGIELAKKIMEIRPDIPIIICSGYFSLQENIAELGRIEFVKKPVTSHDLAQALRRILDRP